MNTDEWGQPEKAAYEDFLKTVDPEHDSVLMLLRAHLYIENRLERIIRLQLSRGDRIVTKGNLGYYQKTVLVDSFDIIQDEIIRVLKNLNRTRNKYAHELAKDVTSQDIERIGNPLGANYTKAKVECGDNLKELLLHVLSYVCGYLDGAIIALEKEQCESVEEVDNAK